jgi:hypothetical protein
MEYGLSAGYKFLAVAMIAVSFVSREAQIVRAVSSALVLGLKALVS